MFAFGAYWPATKTLKSAKTDDFGGFVFPSLYPADYQGNIFSSMLVDQAMIKRLPKENKKFRTQMLITHLLLRLNLMMDKLIRKFDIELQSRREIRFFPIDLYKPF